MPAGSGCYAVVKSPEKGISIKTTKNASHLAGVLRSVHNCEKELKRNYV